MYTLLPDMLSHKTNGRMRYTGLLQMHHTNTNSYYERGWHGWSCLLSEYLVLPRLNMQQLISKVFNESFCGEKAHNYEVAW